MPPLYLFAFFVSGRLGVVFSRVPCLAPERYWCLFTRCSRWSPWLLARGCRERGDASTSVMRRLWLRLRSELDEVAAEIELLGSADVRRVAAELGDIVSKHPGLGKAYSPLDKLPVCRPWVGADRPGPAGIERVVGLAGLRSRPARCGRRVSRWSARACGTGQVPNRWRA
jgi:hypothetical protein